MHAERRSFLPSSLVLLAWRKPERVLLAWLVCSLAALVLGTRVSVDTSTDSILDRSAEPWSFYQETIGAFGGDEFVVVALTAESPWSRAMLEDVVALSRSLAEIRGVRRVDSLATMPLIHSGEEGELVLDAALEDGVPASSRALSALREQVRVDRIAPRSLISSDFRTAALNVLLEAEPGRTFESIVAEIREAAEDYDALVSGVPVFRTEINARTASEVLRLGFFAGVLIFFVYALFFGAWPLTLAPLLVGGVGCVSLFAAMGWLGIPLSLSTMILPSVVLALGCAYASHLVFARTEGTGGSVDESSLRRVAMPTALSGLTTAIGFLAISLTPIDALREVGMLGAIGTLITTLAALTLAPALLARQQNPVLPWRGVEVVFASTLTFIRNACLRPGWTLAVAFLLTLGAVMALPKLILETDVTKWFPRGNAVRDHYDEIGRRLSGISPINVVVEAEEGGSVLEPEVLSAIGSLAAYLESGESVGKVLSILDPLHSVHDVFAPGEPQIRSRAAAEQYLVLLEGEEQIADLITSDRQRANIRLRVGDNGSENLLGLARDAEDWWAQNGPTGFRVRATGIMFEFARAEAEVVSGQLRGAGWAVLSIFVLILLIARSLRVAVAAVLSNLAPLAIAFGGVAMLGLPLDAGVVLVVNLALGIAVDDTIHVTSGAARLSDPVAAACESLPPLLASTGAIGIGFAVLGASSFVFTQTLGLLTAAIMVLCFFFDVIVLPSLLVLMYRKRNA